ncbi:hypothetical protein CAP35_10790 [Chitinophagaceae bacterium IBVUCB1]|nr:hypothetical protein CAP35_10790 [Chitinophagaceae bacterium IBVUCB1]
MVRKKNIPGLLVVCLACIISLFTFKDYGVAYDEPLQRDIGLISYNYIIGGNDSLFRFHDRDHGVAFEVPLIAIEKILKLTDSRDVYLMRHIATHLFYLLGVFCSYILLLKLYKKQSIAIIGMLLILCHPRIYAHSFFNTKDLPFLTACTISFLTLYISIEKQRWQYTALHAAICAYATAIRILGIMLPAITILMMICMVIINRKENMGKKVLSIGLYILLFLLFLWMFWPLMWQQPILHFAETWQSLSKFRWGGTVLFMGDVYAATAIPRHYLPVWIAISTPIIYLIAPTIAIASTLVMSIVQPNKLFKDVPLLYGFVFAVFTILPIAYIIYIHAVVYDDWRHVYFTYPAIVIVTCYLLYRWHHRLAGKLLLVFIGVQITITVYDMIKLHPYQQVYFNALAPNEPEYLRHKYEMEYWGTSYKEALEYILATDKKENIKVYGLWPMVENNMLILPPVQRKRIIRAWREDSPDYFVTVFRGHPADYTDLGIVCYEKHLQNNTIMRIYKMH